MDAKLDETKMSKGYKLANKLRNARRFATEFAKDGSDKDMEMRWMSHSEKIDALMEDFEFDKALNTLTDYFWHEFCDKEIELSKQSGRKASLLRVLNDQERRFQELLAYDLRGQL